MDELDLGVVDVTADQGAPGNPLLLCSIKVEVKQGGEIACRERLCFITRSMKVKHDGAVAYRERPCLITHSNRVGR